MLELIITILSGERSGEEIALSECEDFNLDGIPYLLESEAIKFSLVTPLGYNGSKIIVYDNEILPTSIDSNEQLGSLVHTWLPPSKYGSYSTYDALFLNFFGVTELQVELDREDSETILVSFEPIEILASKLSAERVRKMLEYLSQLPESIIYSVFHATRRQASLNEGSTPPDLIQAKLESIINLLEINVPSICQSPLTRLIPEQRVTFFTGEEYIDDTTIAWLAENLSVLSPTDDPDLAILSENGTSYRADIIQSPTLLENTDLYENQVIHGFISALLKDAHELERKFNKIAPLPASNRKATNHISFFSIISEFSDVLLEPKRKRCKEIIKKLTLIKRLIELKIPVRNKVWGRPKITPKIKFNHVYLELYRQIIIWHEHGRPDWSAYENLFGIQNIPILFENFCYFRILEATNLIINHEYKGMEDITDSLFDSAETEVKIHKEPSYWTVGHNNSSGENFINSEGWTTYNSRISKRSNRGKNSRRSPDIVIEISKLNGEKSLLILDAKYSTEKKCFIEYLPQLTMKYIHGIHHKTSDASVAQSLTLLYPSNSDDGNIKSFHTNEYAFDGKYPAIPALQVIGLASGKSPKDKLKPLMEGLLTLHGVNT